MEPVIVLEVLSRELATGCPWELLYAESDNLVVIAESLGGLLWMVVTEHLPVNMEKTKILEMLKNLERTCESPVRSVLQERVEMQSSVLAAYCAVI